MTSDSGAHVARTPRMPHGDTGRGPVQVYTTVGIASVGRDVGRSRGRPVAWRSPDGTATAGVESKARRLLTTGAVRVLRADERRLVAQVEGDHGRYTVATAQGRPPSCSCPSWRRRCSHAVAVALIAGQAAA